VSGTAIVSGGRRGIGRAICVALAGKGFDVLVADIAQDADAEKTIRLVGDAGRRAAFHQADISDLNTHPALLAAADQLSGPLTCLVNNAGVSTLKRGDMLELTPESYDHVMAINLRAAFFLSQAFAKSRIDQTAGRFCSIINVSSANAEIMALDRSDYTLSKSGMSTMSKMFAARLAPHDIHVYDVRPGLIRTDMTKPVLDKYTDFIAAGGVPMPRWGEPEDVGATVAMLASGAMPYSTGDHIGVDGGLALRIWQASKGGQST
jgi:3-oxoacyl-[acyl-carrier protein] reductase